MKRIWIFAVVIAALALPANSLAHESQDHENAAKLCKALRAELGVDPFKQAYGTNENRHNAHGKCVSKHRHLLRRLLHQAVAECKAERQATQSSRPPEGEHNNREDKRAERKAFRECVIQHLRALIAEVKAQFETAAAECKTEREADPVAFVEKYGKGRHKRNAFGKCVVQHVRAAQEADSQA